MAEDLENTPSGPGDVNLAPEGADAGYSNAVVAQMLPTHCCFCGYPLVDADSVQRGYGPICMEKYGRPQRMTGPADPGLLRKAHDMAPQRLRERLLKVAPLNRWEEPDVRHKLVNVATYHASVATSYGDTAQNVQAAGMDISHVVIAVAQTLARGAGYEQMAERMITTHAKENQRRRFGKESEQGEYGRGEADLVIEAASSGTLRLATPYNPKFNDAARGAKGLFFKFEKEQGAFWRYFRAADLNRVVNLLVSIFGDRLVLGPDRTLAPLPTLRVFEEPPETRAAPAPKEATNEVSKEVGPDIRVGDRVKLPDGREMTVSWVGVGRGEKRIGVGPKGRYEFFAMSDAKLMSPQAATAVLKEGAVQVAADAKKEGVAAPALPTKVERPVPASAFDYQIEGIRWLDERGRAILADGMGVGKTLQTATVIDPPALVVCPAKLKVNWIHELTKWRPELTAQIISGTEPLRADDLKASVVVINYDLLAAHKATLSMRKWKTLVFDEAHALKNMDVRWNKETRRMEPTSKGPQRASAAYEIWRNAERVFVLTGTPILNRTRELWPLLHMVDPKEWRSFWDFGLKYCAGYEQDIGRGRKVWNFNGRSNSDELHQRVMGRYMLRRVKEDVLKDLPEKTRFTTFVSLDAATAKKYQRAADDFIRWVLELGGPAAAEKASRAEVLTRMNALRQLSAAGKVEAALEWIWDFYDSRHSPLLVWGYHKGPLEAITARLTKGEKSDDTEHPPLRVELLLGGTPDKRVSEVKARFQAGELDVLVMSIPAMGTGHTLTAASDAVFIEREWRPGILVQAEDRCHRIGSKNAVSITYLDAEGTIDIALGALLLEKAKTIAGVIDGQDLDEPEALSRVMEMIFGTEKGSLKRNPGRRSTRLSEALPFSWNDPL